MRAPADALLAVLLDAYERRAAPAMRAISIGPTQLSGYQDDHDPTMRQAINAACQVWEARGWLTVRWVRGEVGNLLERITLCPEATPAIYAYLERIPLAEQRAQLSALWQAYRPTLSLPAQAVLDDLFTRLATRQSISPFTLGEPERNTDLMRIWVALDALTSEVSERDFSARVLGDSKRFTVLKAAALTLLQRSRPELATLSDAEAWSAVGLLTNPGHLYLHGPLVIALEGWSVDLRAFVPDLGLPVAALAAWEIVECQADYILTVENRTTYYNALAAAPESGLTIYLGGFPNAARRAWLRRLSNFVPQLPFYHWGDIDYGGFAILAHLRRTVNPAVLPHQMDEETVRHALSLGKPLSQNDVHYLTCLLADPNLQDCHATLRILLEYKIKLEQEMLTPTPITRD